MTRREDVLDGSAPHDPAPGPGPSAAAATGAAPGAAPGLLEATGGAASAVADLVGAGAAGSRGGYTRVLHDVPAAVLLVDVSDGRVVHSNPAARALTGEVRLPVASSRWGEAAGLAVPGGGDWPGGRSPIDRAAAGEPVFGEPVVVRAGAAGRTLWVTGFPLPQDDRTLALVVLFDVEGDLPEARIRDRAVIAAGLSFTISDPHHPENPLVYVNPAFERTTGYSYDEVIGTNCRFLQGPDTDPADVQRVRDAIRAEEHSVVTLLNYRKDGTAFWNELSLSPVYDGEGALTHFVGIQSDVTSRVLVEQERGRVLAAEQAARASSEKAQRRLALLAEATSMLAATLDVDESLSRLTGLVVPLMADWCMVELMGTEGEVRRVASAHVDPELAEVLQRVEALQPTSRTDASPASTVFRTGQPMLLADIPDDVLTSLDVGSELSDAYRRLGAHSGVIVPLRARRQVLGVLSLISSTSGREYDEDDLSMAADLARRAALTVDNARLYQREHDVAEALQRSLLPQLPEVPGLDRAARYLPGSTAAQVGGDWYDLFGLPDGAIGIAVGDVMGHDLTAAAAMGQLRSVLRSYAWQGSEPAVVLDRLDQLVQGLGMAQLATAIYGRVTLPQDGGPGLLRLANAGHLPPVLRTPDGRARLLDEAQSLLVGADLGTHRDELTAELPAGSVLVLYTDGLVEQRGLDPDEGLERLRRAVEAVDGADADSTCDQLLAALHGTERDDDVALLVVRVL